MAIGIRGKLPGVTQEQFEAMDRAVGSDAPDGLIFHASGPVEGGWGILDFWESREQFDRFISEQVAPVMAEAGASPPDIKEFPVHEYLKP
ncbi:MAG: hypothetical protein ACJ764_07315 [Solirubrobacteraceae bacterium]